jgi:hydrogenase maturation protease
MYHEGDLPLTYRLHPNRDVRVIMDEVLPTTVRVLILGVGNPILSDDGVGIHVARELKKMRLPGVDVEELPASGLELLDVVRGYDKVVIIDAIQTAKGKPGDLHVLEERDFERSIHGSSPHGINIATALALGRKLVPEEMPEEVVFFAIEAEDLINVCERLTPKVAEALPGIVERIRKESRSLQ